ncbi:hypothetical protein NP233_g13050 [Leucocoprinus birnbaumii]|uniref:Uncharacterized protein n=1 Tax=Leucocoprinus birnbaumii TaxID=56174 RepID=A0AAD5VIZ7_9AGAR|nr:hypothetical protein NP233_g13050 [Leucocoprinus birnbaumii]
MTEYDYSPEAYEKYLATQARISRWVDDTQRTHLVGPDVPPTPLVTEDSVPLPSTRDESRPTKSKKSSGKKRSKSASRPPTPFKNLQELPEQPEDEPEDDSNPILPDYPVYRFYASPVEKAPSPPPEPSQSYTQRERRGSSAPVSRNSPQDHTIPRDLPGSVGARYVPGYDSDHTYTSKYVSKRVKSPHPATRKRSMSFSAAASQPLNQLPMAAYYPTNGPHHSSPHAYSSHYSSQTSSPHHPSASSATFVPPHPPAAPVPRQVNDFGPQSISKNFSYPLPYQQYPDYDAVRRREISRSHTAPAHTMNQSTDSPPYAYNAPGHSHQRSRHPHHRAQSHSQPASRSASPGISTEPQPGSTAVTFPNGKILYVTPPNADKKQILQHPQLYQVPYEYYRPESPKKKPLLQRLLPSFGKKACEPKNAGPSPTPERTLRRRTSSIH